MQRSFCFDSIQCYSTWSSSVLISCVPCLEQGFLHMLFPYLSSFLQERRGETLHEVLRFGDLFVFHLMYEWCAMHLTKGDEATEKHLSPGKDSWYSKPVPVKFVMLHSPFIHSFIHSFKLPLRNTKMTKKFWAEHSCYSSWVSHKITQ